MYVCGSVYKLLYCIVLLLVFMVRAYHMFDRKPSRTKNFYIWILAYYIHYIKD